MMEPLNQVHRMIRILASRVKSRWMNESGQTMVEYVMLIVLVGLAVFLITPNIKSAILKVFSNTSSALS